MGIPAARMTGDGAEVVALARTASPSVKHLMYSRPMAVPPPETSARQTQMAPPPPKEPVRTNPMTPRVVAQMAPSPAEHLQSAEIQLERKEAERAAAGKEPPIVTPLMVFVRQQRAAKSMARRSGGSRPNRKAPGVVTNISNHSKRASEKRKTSTSTAPQEAEAQCATLCQNYKDLAALVGKHVNSFVMTKSCNYILGVSLARFSGDVGSSSSPADDERTETSAAMSPPRDPA
ncbi:hypothetical protein ABZP36_034988 [Zizania latifolia]